SPRISDCSPLPGPVVLDWPVWSPSVEAGVSLLQAAVTRVAATATAMNAREILIITLYERGTSTIVIRTGSSSRADRNGSLVALRPRSSCPASWLSTPLTMEIPLQGWSAGGTVRAPSCRQCPILVASSCGNYGRDAGLPLLWPPWCSPPPSCRCWHRN